MAGDALTPATYVPTLAAVRWAIDTLQSSKIHPFFIAYLHLHGRAAETGTRTVQPVWEQLAEFLTVSGGPTNKPYYRPFWHGNVDDVGRYWLNRNLAGSYAPSSIRAVPRRVVSVERSEFTLLPDDVRLASTHLLFNDRVSAIALGAYLFRDFGFVDSEGEVPNSSDLSEALQREFNFTFEEFAILFDVTVPDQIDTWFELLTDDTLGVD